MARYTSKYAELAFYVEGNERKFSAGIYEATTEAETAVLDRLVDAVKVSETTAEEPVEKPAPKTPRKTGATSAK